MIERPRELEQGRRKERERESLPHHSTMSPRTLSLPAIGPGARNLLRYAYFRRTPKFRPPSFQRPRARAPLPLLSSPLAAVILSSLSSVRAADRPDHRQRGTTTNTTSNVV